MRRRNGGPRPTLPAQRNFPGHVDSAIPRSTYSVRAAKSGRFGLIQSVSSNQQENVMRFIVMVKATKESESGVMPSEKLLAEMGRFNEELVKAGIMLAGEGLHPSSKGARVKFDGARRTVVD